MFCRQCLVNLQAGAILSECLGPDLSRFGPYSFNGDHLNALSLLHF